MSYLYNNPSSSTTTGTIIPLRFVTFFLNWSIPNQLRIQPKSHASGQLPWMFLHLHPLCHIHWFFILSCSCTPFSGLFHHYSGFLFILHRIPAPSIISCCKLCLPPGLPPCHYSNTALLFPTLLAQTLEQCIVVLPPWSMWKLHVLSTWIHLAICCCTF